MKSEESHTASPHVTDIRYDLHTHTTCSDGALTPAELLQKAQEVGLSGLSITDHDTLNAYTKETYDLAHKLELALLPGVELSTFHGTKSVHILGYNVSTEDETFNALLTRLQHRRVGRNRTILHKLARCALPVQEEELLEFGSLHFLGRPHIAQVMVKKGYVPTVEKAFRKYLGEGCPCYDTGDMVSTEEAIAAIHSAGGKAVVAHPHLLKKRRLVSQLLELPFDGIEGYYGNFRKEEDERWIDLGEKHNLLITGGSDFHGHDKVHARLGASWVTKEVFHALLR